MSAALPLLEAKAPLLLQASDSPANRYDVCIRVGVAMMDAGRHDVAYSWLKQAIEARHQSGSGKHPYAALDHAIFVDNLIMQGRVDDARAALDRVPRFERMRGDGESVDRYARWLVFTRARLLMAAGQASESLAVLREGPAISDDGSYDSLTHADLLGEVQCAAGQLTQGAALLRRQVQAWEQSGDHHFAPWIARIRAVAGGCALQNGDWQVAMDDATQARAAFTAQPGVSSYYKAPLFKLERALGLKLPPV